jgi:hypothetical protein
MQPPENHDDYYVTAEEIAAIPLATLHSCEQGAVKNPWRVLDECRNKALQIRTWPSYAFADVATFVETGIIAYGTTTLSSIILKVQTLSVIGPWRVTRGVYCFDAELSLALANTDPADEIPVDVLLRLPEWSVCIFGAALGVVCAFLSISFGDDTSPPEIVIVAIHDDGTRTLLAIALEAGTTIASGVDTMIKQQFDISSPKRYDTLVADKDRFTTIVSAILAHALYLCADEPDMAPAPPRPIPKKTRSGARFFPPDTGSRIVPVGARFGAMFRRTRAEFAAAENNAKTGRTLPPHWRKAHWQSFWVGPRKPGQQKKIVKWIAPTFVNATPEDIPVVVREVM